MGYLECLILGCLLLQRSIRILQAIVALDPILHLRQLMCRFSDAAYRDVAPHADRRRLRSAKARNRVWGWAGEAGRCPMGISSPRAGAERAADRLGIRVSDWRETDIDRRQAYSGRARRQCVVNRSATSVIEHAPSSPADDQRHNRSAWRRSVRAGAIMTCRS